VVLVLEAEATTSAAACRDALAVYVDAITAQWICALTPEQRAQLDESELDLVPEQMRRAWGERGMSGQEGGTLPARG
jgi:hypothetical protein